jgi:hypothetical protein
VFVGLLGTLRFWFFAVIGGGGLVPALAGHGPDWTGKIII